MNYILFDNKAWDNLLPLTFTRPVSEIRVGILTIKEKWEKYLNSSLSYLTKEYLKVKYTEKVDAENVLIAGNLIPNKNLVKIIEKLEEKEALVFNDKLLAVRLNKSDI
ncbi:MAG TPA: putative sugar nucleotidyl transferase, partial [Bacteroidales bacterium]|nr:putative sugar nucleotidyl transferase [Bacteroidales bacterium]